MCVYGKDMGNVGVESGEVVVYAYILTGWVLSRCQSVTSMSKCQSVISPVNHSSNTHVGVIFLAAIIAKNLSTLQILP